MTTLLTNLAALLSCTAFVGTLALAGHVRQRRAWVQETDTWHTVDEPLPAPRKELTALPHRAPIGEPQHAEQLDAPSADTLNRVLAGLRRLTPPPIELRRVAETPKIPWDMGTPVFDELVQERAALRRAARIPTAEVRVVFDRLVDHWLCTFCELEGCRGCPGCSCSCKMSALIGRPPLVEVAG